MIEIPEAGYFKSMMYGVCVVYRTVMVVHGSAGVLCVCVCLHNAL